MRGPEGRDVERLWRGVGLCMGSERRVLSYLSSSQQDASPDVAAGGQVCYISSALPSPQAEAIMENFTAEYSTTTIGSAILWELL